MRNQDLWIYKQRYRRRSVLSNTVHIVVWRLSWVILYFNEAPVD